MRFDFVNEMAPSSVVRLHYTAVVGSSNKEDLKVVVDDPHKGQYCVAAEKAPHTVVDSSQDLMLRTECDHKEIQYAARKDAAAVVLDP